MKKIIALTFALVTSFATAQEVTYNFPILRVIDGDTVVIAAEFLPPPLSPTLSLRILGVDTPEKGSTAKCPEEVEKGKAATTFARQQILNAKVKEVKIVKWDKYGGRILGDVILDGQSLRDILISSGYARPYNGGFKKSWCN